MTQARTEVGRATEDTGEGTAGHHEPATRTREATARPEAVLVLEDGRSFAGHAYGATGTTVGEAVFCTAMTGYQETLTDPSYHRQVVVMTAPHVGNTGVNDEDGESSRIWVAGFVVRDPARRASSWRSRGDLGEELAAQGVVGISGVDTRALTRHLRERGAMRVGVFSGEALHDPTTGRRLEPAELLAAVLDAPTMRGADLAGEVTTPEPYVVEPVGEPRTGPDGRPMTVVALDLGIKSRTPWHLAQRGVRTHVLPSSASTADVLALQPHGVFYSNGPGDPAAAEHEVGVLQDVLERRVPFFGICYGNQLLGRALGLGTYKLGYGHRGVNQPVMDSTTGSVEITAHNHGFAVDAPIGETFPTPYGPGEVSHWCLNDRVVEGLRLLETPAFSVQYHPEAAAGPHDAGYLFDRFCDLMAAPGEQVPDTPGHDSGPTSGPATAAPTTTSEKSA
ncbi:glutamine-hydrolyzing carbamoyl-phosphate synthase small subunit [Pseudokineococcus sp. 1T1Z-3]|uniref:glutamine-hydrolyzing carbamoyl-phosphate synthase small subunit n=1 Tax=Pseudokineococcus sp. 1T1Z-3 TaxID=3132745 RepID=UPI0030A09A8D